MGWLLIVGIILFFLGFIIAMAFADSYDGGFGIGIGVIMLLAGIVLIVVGGISINVENSAADAAGIKQVNVAAEAQGLVITDPYRTGATVIGDKCTLDADLVDDKLALSGSDPTIVLTPDYVDLVCQGASR